MFSYPIHPIDITSFLSMHFLCPSSYLRSSPKQSMENRQRKMLHSSMQGCADLAWEKYRRNTAWFCYPQLPSKAGLSRPICPDDLLGTPAVYENMGLMFYPASRSYNSVNCDNQAQGRSMRCCKISVHIRAYQSVIAGGLLWQLFPQSTVQCRGPTFDHAL